MAIGDPRASERGGQRVPGEVRVPARGGIAAHVHDLAHAMRRQQRQEIVELAGRVADRVDHFARYLDHMALPVYT